MPYEDKRAVALMLRAAKDIGVDRVVLNGDIVDCAIVSSHSKDKLRLQKFSQEIAAANEFLDRVDDLGATERNFVEGNHEFRIPRYIQEHAPEFADLDELKIQNLLRLKERGWTFTPYKDFMKVGKLHVTHEVGKAGPNAHRDAMNVFQDNVFIGHVHHMSICYGGDAKGRTHVGATFGWLGDKRKVDYMFRVKANRDWMSGFGWGYLEPNGVIHLQAIPIINYSVVIEGKLFRG